MFFLSLLKSIFCFAGSYSNEVFLDPLSIEEESKYITEKMQGNEEARCKLIEHNLRLVAHIVKKYDSKLCDTDDLISIGTIGLIKGVDTFSPEKNVRITTYCARCIENEILMYFRKNNRYSKDISIQDAIGYDKDGNEISIEDVLQVDYSDFCDDIDLKDNVKALYRYLDVLTPRERNIIVRRYGLGNTLEQTQKTISEKMGISRSYVSRIEKRALTKLFREFMRDRER